MEINIPGRAGGVPLRPQWGVIFTLILILVGLSSLGTLFYTVNADEVGVVQRFGRYILTTQPGLNFKLPFGIETVKKVRVTHVFKEEFGFRTLQPGVRSIYDRGPSDDQFAQGLRGYEAESLMLTGDLNMAVVEWIVQYRIKDPVQYVFKVRNVRETLRNMSEAIMRLVVGDRTINEVLTVGREEVHKAALEKLQTVLDEYETGIHIINLVLQDVNPPEAVKPSFNEVNEARQEKEKMINQAWEDYNRVIPRAKGLAEKTVREAEGYALNRVNRSRGDAEKFLDVWNAYKEAKVVTRTRLYLETMKEVLPNLELKYIIDSRGSGILPILDLTKAVQEVKEGGQKS